jgi:sRNA-binding carbon storage regulator CsrA
MLMIARREGETLEMYLSPEIDPSTPIGEVLGHYPIRITVDELRSNQAALAVDAPQDILVLREELLHHEILE